MDDMPTSPDDESAGRLSAQCQSTYLFRFRDLIASTIEEHRRIIDEDGACWWGWWKRPSEQSRADIWRAIQSRASVSSPFALFLFDSGSGDVYLAKVTQIIPPRDDAPERLALPESEERLVPSYYRNSPFSRAWMKLTEIQGPTPFFGAYSFSKAPVVANYSESLLRQFHSKVVTNADELRAMDTTIWEIRPRLATDAEVEIILGTLSVSVPISRQPIHCSSNRVLHLSDLHMAIGANRREHVWRLESEDGSPRPRMTDALSAASHQEVKIGLIVVTGDLTHTGEAAEYLEVQRALVHLLGIYDLSPDNLVIVPGNHDIRWSTDDTYDPQSEVHYAPAEATKNYRDFYLNLFRHEPNMDLSMGRRYLLPSGLGLEICGLNSSALETGRNYLAGMGRINEMSFAHAAAQLGWNDAKSVALRILAIHHHLAPTEDLEPACGYERGFGIAVDAAKIQRLAARKGVQLALHGHKHRAFLWRSNVYELPEHTQRSYELGDLAIVGAGSVGSSETEGHNNYFNLFDFSPDGVNLSIYRSTNSGAFDHMQTWRAALGFDREKHRLILDAWKPYAANT